MMVVTNNNQAVAFVAALLALCQLHVSESFSGHAVPRSQNVVRSNGNQILPPTCRRQWNIRHGRIDLFMSQDSIPASNLNDEASEPSETVNEGEEKEVNDLNEVVQLPMASSEITSDKESEKNASDQLLSDDKTKEDAADNILAQKPPKLPNLSNYFKFALPCLGLWIAQPLLSLVDTAFVGLSGSASTSAQQLAALGPATTSIDGATYLFAFLNVACTNLYSTACAKNGLESDQAESVVRTASKVAIRCGVGIMLFLFAFARPMMALYIGEKAAATPGLLDAAVAYVHIRAVSMPTSLLLGVVQAALLGAKDSVTPLVAILYSTIVNVVGDYILVRHMGMGLQGAAIATTLAQWVSTATLLGPARKKLVRNGSLGLFNKGKRKPVDETPESELVTGRSFVKFAAPVLTLILGKIAAFGFMTHVAAALPGQPTVLAAHQIILSLFFFVSPFMEVISQTAQTFIPPYLAPVSDYIAKKKKESPGFDESTDAVSKPWESSAVTVSASLLKIGVVAATVVASLAAMIPAFFGNTLTSDRVVQRALQPMSKHLWAGAFLTAPVAVSEGALLARRQLKYLASVYVISSLLLPPALIHIKRSTGGTVEQVWACFAIFQLFRATAFLGRVWGKSISKRVSKLFGREKPSLASKAV